MNAAFKPRLVQPDPPTDEPTLDRLLATRTRLIPERRAVVRFKSGHVLRIDHALVGRVLAIKAEADGDVVELIA